MVSLKESLSVRFQFTICQHCPRQWLVVYMASDYCIEQRGYNALTNIIHYNDVIMGALSSQITSPQLFTQTFIHAQMKENIKAPRHWPLCGDSPVTGEFLAQRDSNAENVSIWWRHHVCKLSRNISTSELSVAFTDWGRVTHSFINQLTIIGSVNGLSPGRHQTIIWTHAWILLIGPLW